MSDICPSPLLNLPRELRNAILEIVVRSKKVIHSHLKAAPQPYDGVYIKSTSAIILSCRQLHKEYTEMLQHVALTTPPPEREIRAVVWNVNFDAVIAFVNQLPPSSLPMLQDGRKLKIDLLFSSAAETKRSNLLRWLDYANSLGVKANYAAPHSLDRKRPFRRVTYVNIYDLFSEEGSDREAEEERMFRRLQWWYAIRHQGWPQKCGTGRAKRQQQEYEDARRLGLRTMKTAEDCERPVRAVSPTT